MKRSLLSRLQRNGAFYLLSAFLLLIGVPSYQAFVLVPQGYANALAATQVGRIALYLSWVGIHSFSFLIYRVLLLLAFVLLLSMPFSLFRIIVAQELMAQQEELEQAQVSEDDEEEEEGDEQDGFDDEDEDYEEDEEEHETPVDEDAQDEDDEEEELMADDEEESESIEVASDGMPPYPWRGKGFAVIAAWSGIFGVIVYILGTFASTLFLLIVSRGVTGQDHISSSITTLLSIFSIITNTAGIGLLALAALFFGAIIARRGLRLWPGEWVGFGYVGLGVSALLSGSAVAVASAPTSGQTVLTSPAILLFALWMAWLGVMLVRLRPEP